MEALRLKSLHYLKLYVIRYKSIVPILQLFDGFDVISCRNILDNFDSWVIPVSLYDSRSTEIGNLAIIIWVMFYLISITDQ